MTTAHVFMFGLAFLVAALLIPGRGCLSIGITILASLTIATGIKTISDPGLLAEANANHPNVATAAPGTVDGAVLLGALLVIGIVAMLVWRGVKP